MPQGSWISTLFGAIAGVLALFAKSKKLVLALLIAAIFFSLLTKWPGGDWQVANCDVGQGDSMVINLGNHRAIVIDAGPDAELEDRCLEQLGIYEIPLLVLTHFHADHVEGVAGLINHRSVGEVWVSNNLEPSFESARVHQWLSAVKWRVALRGDFMQVASNRGQISAQVLWPDSADHSFFGLPGDGSGINNSSIALLLRSPDFSLFACGDLEPPAQAEIISDLEAVDIYKVCHHGSAYQDKNLMQRLSPALSIISVGVGNSYGHPATQTLQSLTRLGSVIYRTDRSGAIAVRARRHHLKVEARSGTWWQKVRLG